MSAYSGRDEGGAKMSWACSAMCLSGGYEPARSEARATGCKRSGAAPCCAAVVTFEPPPAAPPETPRQNRNVSTAEAQKPQMNRNAVRPTAQNAAPEPETFSHRKRRREYSHSTQGRISGQSTLTPCNQAGAAAQRLSSPAAGRERGTSGL